MNVRGTFHACSRHRWDPNLPPPRVSDEEIDRIAREIAYALGRRLPSSDPRFDVLSMANELPAADEDRVIRALGVIFRLA